MVTDTAMVRKNGKIYAFGPVVRELDIFLALFESVKWIGFNRPELHDNPALIPVPDAVKCVLLKRSGGDGLIKKLGVLTQIPVMLWRILKSIVNHEVIHTRAPSSPAFIAAVLSFFFKKKIWWHKYAGNWAQENPPFFYGIQRKWLQMASWSKVTINGRWPGQPSHCISFENPCLNEEEQAAGSIAIAHKTYDPPYECCFVGRLEDAKGVGRILEAMKEFSPREIKTLHLVGDGPNRALYEEAAAKLSVDVIFHGFLDRDSINSLYASCHFLLLPSASEGFPKVLAEAMNYGCIPVSSNVSSIPHYIIHKKSGFLWDPGGDRFSVFFQSLINNLSERTLLEMPENGRKVSEAFTYLHYGDRINAEILGRTN